MPCATITAYLARQPKFIGFIALFCIVAIAKVFGFVIRSTLRVAAKWFMGGLV